MCEQCHPFPGNVYIILHAFLSALGGQSTLEYAKHGLLIELFAQNAPQAIMNHGANALRQGAPGNAAYASKAALFDESTWLLWRMSRKEHGPSGLPASSARDNKPPALP